MDIINRPKLPLLIFFLNLIFLLVFLSVAASSETELPSNTIPDGFVVAVTAPTEEMPDPSPTMSAIRKFFGGFSTNDDLKFLLGSLMGVDIIIEVRQTEEVFTQLARFAGEKQISVLYILGHGSSDRPHISLTTSTSLDPEDVDVKGMQDKARKYLKTMKYNESKYCSIKTKEFKTNEDLQEMELLDNENYADAYELGKLRESLKRLEALSDVMADKGVVQLLNCSGAASGRHIEFLENIGRVLMWKRGGTVWASTTDIIPGQVSTGGYGGDILDVPNRKISQLSSQMHSGSRVIKPGDYYMVGDWREFPITKGPLFDDKLMAELEKFKLNRDKESNYNMPECQPKPNNNNGSVNGYWNLVSTDNGLEEKDTHHQCYDHSASGGSGSVTYTINNKCQKPPTQFIGVATWGIPPSRLIPGAKYILEMTVRKLQQDKNLFQSIHLTAKLEPVRIQCGSTAGGSMRLHLEVGSKEKDLGKRKIFTFVAPSFGDYDSGTRGEGKFAILFCTPHGGFKYIYKWMPKNTNNKSKQTLTQTPDKSPFRNSELNTSEQKGLNEQKSYEPTGSGNSSEHKWRDAY